MDLSSIKKNGLNDAAVSFSGSKTVKDEYGDTRFRVFPQNINLEENEELGVELLRMNEHNEKGSKYTQDYSKSIPINVAVDDEFKSGKKSYFDINLRDYRLKNSGEFGYRFVVRDKNTKEVKRAFTDSTGTVIDHDGLKFTVASTRQGTPKNQGPMEHIFTDSWNTTQKVKDKMKSKNPEMSDEEAIDSFRRNHFNRAGGTINGITEKLDSELSPYKLIMTTPLIGGGSASSHMYHPKNHFHISEGMGTKEDFMNLQKECFENGKGYVLDGAFTSQGYEGLQLNHAMKWSNSPFKYWFKNPSDSGYELGVLSDTDNSNAGIRIVNPKGVAGYNYNPDMPTYVQFYDTRLADDQLNDYGSLIKEYDTPVPDDPYDISTWHDGIIPNYFEVDPNSKAIKGKAYGSLDDWDSEGRLQDILNPDNMPRSFVRKGLSSGTTGWDGNIDLVKMNLSNHENSVESKEGSNQARNYMYNIARYWTEETRNTLIMDVAQNLHEKGDVKSAGTKKYLSKIEENFDLEEGRLLKVSKNISAGKKYNSQIVNNQDKRSASDIVREEMLEFPLESLEYSPELLSVLSTPYITPRPSAKGNPAAGKLEVYKDAKSNTHTKLAPSARKLYDETLPGAIKEIMYTIQEEQGDESKRFFECDGDGISELTPYGKYFLEMSMNDMMNFFVTEGLFEGDTKASYETGSLNYAKGDEDTKGDNKRFTLNKLNIHETTPDGEAEAVAKKLKNGLENLQNKKPDKYAQFKDYLVQKYYSLDMKDYQTAEAVIDQTGAGLNWRFDAAKDVGDFEEAKSGSITSGDVWDDVVDFWTPFVKEVRKYNPSSYIIAEVTSLHDFDSCGGWGRYKDADTAEKIFYEVTGATTGSNYSTYFGLYPKLFGQNTEEGSVDNHRNIINFLNQTQNFIHPDDKTGRIAPEFAVGSHVFLDNHDKPRTAHLMAVDAGLFWSNFKNNDEYKKTAEKVLQREYDDTNMNSKAVAVADKYHEYFGKEGKKLGLSRDEIQILKDAASHLANGYKMGKKPSKPDYNRADAFGTSPYEVTLPHVLKQAKTMGLEIDRKTRRTLIDSVRYDMVEPYISKMPAVYELMTGTTGIPTLYSGDELAQTGCETKSKNWSLGNRNIIRHDWLDENKKSDVVKFNKRMKSVSELSKKAGMAPLSGGTPLTILPEFEDIVSKDDLIEGAKKLSDGDLKAAYGFLNSAAAGSKDDIFNEIKSMDENELKSKFFAQMKKINSGCANWVLKNINPKTQTGAVYKYNEKGEGVISVVTNAYIPEDPKPSPLNELTEDKKPGLSNLQMKDTDGNLIAPVGTVFVKKKYDELKGDYVDDGIYTLSKDGKLKDSKGQAPVLDSTVTYFYKQKPFYTNYSKAVG
ncbi:MAG: hypothetical protein LUE64_07385 [Candidatus Gastranaerophilales bacterium]|nr:hypothetical protein [Candidatus Gastranaerophilales bacterium]